MDALYSFGNFRIKTIVNGGDWKENCYLVMHEIDNSLILVDPGDSAEDIISSIASSFGSLHAVLLTHAHHDHVGAASLICDHFNLRCQLHKDDVRLLHHAPMYAMTFAKKRILPVKSYLTFETGDLLTIGDICIRILHTPGHTPGSVCIDFGGFIFTGDTVLFEHIGRTDLPGGDPKLILASIDKLFLECGDRDPMLFPGHGRPWKLSEAALWWEKSREIAPNYMEPGGLG